MDSSGHDFTAVREATAERYKQYCELPSPTTRPVTCYRKRSCSRTFTIGEFNSLLNYTVVPPRSTSAPTYLHDNPIRAFLRAISPVAERCS